MRLRLSLEKKSQIYILIVLLLIIDFILFGFWLNSNQKKNTLKSVEDYPEISTLANKNYSFKELQDYFTSLANTKGARYTYEVLKRAPIPPNIDMHLLGHIVGDELYKQEGIDGIKVCTQDFRNACSHAIVIGLFDDNGESALEEITKTCKQAPGGSGAYAMCFHGLGHGILAYYGYELPKAIESCKKTSSSNSHLTPEAIECTGGTVMEIIGGGGHDPELWAKQSRKYVNLDDPLSLCLSDFMPQETRLQCFVYLTPALFKAAGADLGHPTPDNFQKAFTFCESIPKSDITARNACFGGFGKEFVVLAQERDIRKIDQMTTEQLQRVYDWCQLTNNRDGVKACVVQATNSLYWGGENSRSTAINFCGLIDNQDFQSVCFNNLISSVRSFIADRNYKAQFCHEIPDKYKDSCINQLL